MKNEKFKKIYDYTLDVGCIFTIPEEHLTATSKADAGGCI